MTAKRRQKFIVFLVLVFGFFLFYQGTDSFTAFTEETARVNELIDGQPEFPDVTFEDSNERVYDFSEFTDQYVLVTFIYTSCTTVCLELEMNMAQVYDMVPDEYIGDEVVFLSISFDPKRDDPATLDHYKDYFTSDGETWRMARITDQDELDTLLDAFGVIVIPDGYGDFAHNAAFYLVDSDGRLVDVLDYNDPEAAAGFFMPRFFQMRFPDFFGKWNHRGIPGIILFVIITMYWMVPRTMDEALVIHGMEIFKFISLPFLAGVPLRDSWRKLGSTGKSSIFIIFTIVFISMGWLYIASPVQLCNNYLLVEQITLGWGFLTMATCMVIYLIYITIIERKEVE